MKLDQDPQASPRESGNLEYEDLCEKAGSQRECQWQLTHSGGTAVKVTATLLARASEPRTAQSGPINHETRFASSQRYKIPPNKHALVSGSALCCDAPATAANRGSS